jgi:hypothetical protein
VAVIVLVDPNADLVKQLTRIADALSKPSPSPWTELAKTLVTFALGIATTYFAIWLQGRLADKRAQRKMRRIVYTELSSSFIQLCELVDDVRATAESPRKPNSAGEIFPPMARILNSPFTSAGEEYMNQNHSVSYELPEMTILKRMYVELGRLSSDKTVALGDLEMPLVRFGREFKRNSFIRNNFRKFAGEGRPAIEAVAKFFADYTVKIEDFVVLAPTKPSGDSE